MVDLISHKILIHVSSRYATENLLQHDQQTV